MMIRWTCQLVLGLAAVQLSTDMVNAEPPVSEHPRLYFSTADLPALRANRTSGVHARIWANLTRSADWCAAQPVREEWIPTIADDPQFENLYDRFYAAMHDTAIVEHLALTSALSDPENDPYFDAARKHLLAAARVWKHEANNAPDASKAYAVLRVVKALAVGYDALYHRLAEDERQEVRDAIVAVGAAYYNFFQEPTTAGEGYDKHHGSVDASPFGIMALALLGEVDQAQAWLDLAVQKHVDYLLPHALTPSGTSEYGTTFCASTLQYRILFVDPLRRVTGRDLLAEFPDALPGQMALAAVAGRQPSDLQFNENNRSIVSAPDYAQIDYWSPVLLYLARHGRRPIYQHLALWDESLGSLQHTRFITPTRKEELLFSFGPYAYLWYDADVTPAIEDRLPHSFAFPEPMPSEAYMRASYDLGGIVVALGKGLFVVHAGGRPVLVDHYVADDNKEEDGEEDSKKEDSKESTAAIKELLVTDDGGRAVIRCVGPEASGLGEQRAILERPSKLTIKRQSSRPLSWWYAGDVQQKDNSFLWPDGTQLTIAKGVLAAVTPDGFTETKIHYGGMKWADPHPFVYPTITVEPVDGQIVLEIVTPDHAKALD